MPRPERSCGRADGERRSPDVQPDPRAQTCGIGRDCDYRLGGALEQKVAHEAFQFAHLSSSSAFALRESIGDGPGSLAKK